MVNPKAQITVAVIFVLWLIIFYKGSFLRDEEGANDIALGTQVKIFRDIRMKLIRQERLSDGSLLLATESSFKGKKAGFEILLGPKWVAQKVMDLKGVSSHQGLVTFKRSGPQSDLFLEMLDQYYSAHQGPKTMVERRAYNALILEGDPATLEGSKAKINLFHNGIDEEDYAEFYLYIDFSGKEIILGEKDTDYRKPLLGSLLQE